MSRRWRVGLGSAAVVLVVAGAVAWWTRASDSTPRPVTASSSSASTTTTSAPATGYPGMPPVVDPTNIYSEIGPTHLSPFHASDPALVYVPNGKSNTVSVIDRATRTVISAFPTGAEPQHVVPSYDLATLWVLDNQGNDVIPIDPATGAPGAALPVEDPYN